MLNTQPAEKRSASDGSELEVNSIFYTIQGEGPFAGSPSIFVRLAGCNLQCPLCDTSYLWRTRKAVDKILEDILAVNRNSKLVVITGGEPFRQKLNPLVRALIKNGYTVQIETNGSYFEPGLPYGDRHFVVVCSPKAGKINHQLMPHITALKYVATAESLVGSLDGLPHHALEHPNGGLLARPSEDFKGMIYLQAVDEQDVDKNKINLDAVTQSCLKNGWLLCIQIHKLIGVE